jgi:hypothetical protein
MGYGQEYSSGGRWARSASFDHSARESGLRHTPKRAPRPPPLETSRDIVTDYVDLDDAAPTPSIPGGPRRRQEAVALPAVPITPKKSAPSRQNSVKSSRTLKRGKTSSGLQEPPSIRDQARQFVSQTNSIRNGQGLASIENSAAPSPTVGGSRKTFPSPTVPQPQPKERPGFFRKFFGSSKSSQNSQSTANNHDDHATQRRQSSNGPERPRTQPAQAPSGYQSSSRPPTQDTHSSSSQTLRKSTSSFFRRRKKSVSENNEPVPPVPLLHQQYQNRNLNPAVNPQSSFSRLSLKNGASEENSLRNIMAPYLAETISPTTPNEAFYDTQEHQLKYDNGLENQVIRTEKGNHRDVLSPSYGTQESFGLHGGSNMDRSREMKNGNLRQISSVRAVMRGIHDSEETTDSEPSYRNIPSKSPTFLSDSAFQALESVDAPIPSEPSALSEPAEPSRPAPVPMSYNVKTKEGGLTLALPDKPLLSPISDRSFLTNDTKTPPLLDGTTDEFVIPRDSTINDVITRGPKNPRVWLRPSDSEEALRNKSTEKSSIPTEDKPSPKSPEDVFSSATSLPIVQVDDKDLDMNVEKVQKSITEEDHKRAQQIFEGDETFLTKAMAASWLGQTTLVNTRTRKAYMELFDWNGLNILSAFRELCSHLVVRAESQQLDRIIDAFSERWCECNPNNGFKDRG